MLLVALHAWLRTFSPLIRVMLLRLIRWILALLISHRTAPLRPPGPPPDKVSEAPLTQAGPSKDLGTEEPLSPTPDLNPLGRLVSC